MLEDMSNTAVLLLFLHVFLGLLGVWLFIYGLLRDSLALGGLGSFIILTFGAVRAGQALMMYSCRVHCRVPCKDAETGHAQTCPETCREGRRPFRPVGKKS